MRVVTETVSVGEGRGERSVGGRWTTRRRRRDEDEDEADKAVKEEREY